MKYEIWIRECDHCQHRFAEIDEIENHTQRVYSDDYFSGGGAGYPDYLRESQILVRIGEQYARIMSRFTKPGRILDIGSAAGFILRGFSANGWNGKGIEPNATMSRYGREELGLDIETGTLEDFQSDVKFDLLTMIQVVPHFVDIHKALSSAVQLTRPGGYWLIETWDRNSVFSRFLGASWHEYTPPSVVHWFSKSSLRDLIAEYGYIEISSGRPHKVIGLDHAISLLKYKWQSGPRIIPFGSILKATIGSLSIPYIFDDIYWSLYKSST